ncbi:MAG: SBBP repeat-containing protein, partial [Leuconostoc mesenteroides]
ANASALDGSGNLYVVGTSASTGLTSASYDHTLVKYNSSGIEQWTKSWGGDGDDRAKAVVLDSSGNIYVAGNTASTGLTAGSNDQTLVKYNSSGVEQWSKTWGGTGSDGANAVTIDGADNIYVVGYTASTGLTAGSNDQTLVKYNTSGVEQWSKTWGGTSWDSARAVTVDTSGNIYVAGEASGIGLTAGGFDQTLVKYNSSGVEQWSKTWGDVGADTAAGVGLDASGNIYVTGYGVTIGLTPNNFDQTLVKYNSSGVEQWSKVWGGVTVTAFLAETASSLNIDNSGYVYVAGYSNVNGITSGNYDQTLLKFDSTGSIANCASCVDRTTSEVDRTMTEVDRTVTEVDRTTSSVDRTMTEVDRTGVAVITDNIGMDVGASLGGVAQNTAATAPVAGAIFRLRTQVHVADNRAESGSATFKLQYAAMSGTCDVGFSGETYADVTTSTPIAYANNTLARDGQLLLPNANDPTHSGHTNVFQEYNETNNTTIVNNIPIGQDGVWDFALKDNAAPSNTSYCFRLVKSDNSLLNT